MHAAHPATEVTPAAAFPPSTRGGRGREERVRQGGELLGGDHDHPTRPGLSADRGGGAGSRVRREAGRQLDSDCRRREIVPVGTLPGQRQEQPARCHGAGVEFDGAGDPSRGRLLGRAPVQAEVPGTNAILQQAKGLLIFPHVYEGGFVFAGEYGEGVLLVNRKPVDYYNIVSASWGFQAGAQRKSVIIAFMTDQALQDFRNSGGWEIGADAKITVVTAGAEGATIVDSFHGGI